MREFLEVFRFECRYQRRGPLFLVVAAVFFLLTFLATASDAVIIGGVGANLNINASMMIVQTQFVMSVIAMFPAVAFVAGSITRDYEVGTAELLFSTGVGSTSHLLGRFFGGYLFAVLVCMAGVLGTLVGSLMPWLDPERIGPFTLAPYWFSTWAVVVPNLFIVGAFFFAAAALGRSMSLAYACSIVFLVAWISLGLFVDEESRSWAALADPFGGAAMGEETRYWTVFERNTALPGGSVIANRLIWVGAGVLALALTAWRYRFELSRPRFRLRLWRRKRRPDTAPPALRDVGAEPAFGLAGAVSQFRSQLYLDVRGVLRGMPFYVILALGIFNVLAIFYGSLNQQFGTSIYPRTVVMTDAILGGFFTFVFIIMIYYSGELIHRERQSRIAEIVDATPYSGGVMVLSKIVALWFIVTMLLLVVALTSMTVQLATGFTDLEPALYLQAMFVLGAAQMYLHCVLAVFIQTLASNKWLGMLAYLALYIFLTTIAFWDFEHVLYGFRTMAGPYSDMNGWGHYLLPFFSTFAYWAALCVVLVLAAHLMFRRGLYDRFGARLVEARRRTSAGLAAAGALALVMFAALGGFIYYNTNVLNEYLTRDDAELRQAEYEKTYGEHKRALQPDYLDIDAEVDIFSGERRVESRGRATVVNATDTTLTEFLVTVNPQLAINRLEFEGAALAEQDPAQGAYLFRFDSPLAPGRQLGADWDFSWINEGFANSGDTTRVVENGTFVDNFEIFPILGYDMRRELGDNNTRRRYDLPPVERLPAIDDAEFLGIGMLGARQRTDFRVVMSTSEDQIAISPGYLQREWTEGGRRYFEYEMDDPIWPFFSFSSARYAVERDRWNDVAIEIYYDPKHAYNIGTMIESTKRSLDYFSREFSPYQYRQFRVLEFPRYATFAQSFPNTIPYSEAIGFIADVRDPKEVDFVFYVTAHEMAHQWWAHQVLSAATQGMTVVVETLAQYSALMVMEEQYGEDMMRRFLRRELDTYLQQRGGELIEELPLVLNENQPYIHYNKGSVVMYALRDLIGEDRVNLALRSFLGKYAFAGPPYPTARDLVAEFRAVAAPEHQAVITDWFEKITLYELGVDEAAVAPVDGSYEVTLTVSAEQFEADGEGEETSVPLSAWLDIGVFPAVEAGAELGDFDLPTPLYLEKHLITTGTQTITVRVDAEPRRVGIDPYAKMIDRNPDDNLFSL